MNTYQEETFDGVIDEIKPLLEKHWEEIAMNKDNIKLSPDYAKYEQLYNADILRIFTVRSDTDELLGYFIVMVMPHIHYQEHNFAINDILYISKKCRGGKVAMKLLRHAEQALKKSNVSVIMINMKVHAPFDKLLLACRYKETERVYTKYIGVDNGTISSTTGSVSGCTSSIRESDGT